MTPLTVPDAIQGIRAPIEYAGGRIDALTGLVPSSVIIREGDLSGADDGRGPAGGHGALGEPSGPHSQPAPRPPRSSACRRWMPRAKAHCVLPRDHAGRCRSR